MTYESNKEGLKNLSDVAVLREIGRRMKSMRLNRDMTQEQLAERAGLDRTTVVQLEGGRSATLLTLIRILRVLDRLEALEGLNEGAEVSPLQVAKLLEKARERASRHPKPSKGKNTQW